MRHIEDIIKLLATHGDLYLLIDHLLEKYVNPTIFRIQAVLIMNAIISSKENDSIVLFLFLNLIKILNCR